jgi:integrase/recombinase XerD
MPTINPRPDRGGKYQLRYQDVDGAYYRIDTGTTDVKVARVWLTEAEKRLSLAKIGQTGKVGKITIHDVMGISRRDQAAVKMSVYRNDYIDRCRHELEMSDSTLELIGNAFDSFLGIVPDRKIGDIKSEHIRKWKREVQVSKTTVAIYQRTLRAAFARAAKWEMIAKNPFEGIEVPKTDVVRPHMTYEHVRLLLETIDEPWYLMYIRFLLYTGKRRNEILHLKSPDDIDTENWVLRIWESKTRRHTEIPIGKALRETIDWDNLNTGYVFDSFKIPGRPWGEYTVSHKFKVVCQKAGLPDTYSLHSIRHTYATHLRSKGVPRDIVQALLGHTSPDTTAVYDHTVALHFRNFADMVDFEEG